MESLLSAKTQSWLFWFFRGILILGFLVLVGRLFELQIIKGSYFRYLAEGNRLKRIPIRAPRGRILARGGEVLVGNVKTQEPTDDLMVEWSRNYALAHDFAHVSGYLGLAQPQEVGKIDAKCPEKGPKKLWTLLGRSGLEEQYECRLSGFDGEELVEVDTLGKKIRLLGRRDPIRGEDLKTSIHFGLQKKVAELMRDRKGAVVVTDTKGEVLALYSAPSFDPNIFTKKGNQTLIEATLKDVNLPLFNRAIAGLYHPGSTFKPIVAIAALEEGKIDASFDFEDPGVIEVNKFFYSNWYFSQYGKKEGKVDLVRAMARSVDTFFYKVGELLGAEKIAFWAEKFGLAKETGLDIPGEGVGIVPTPEWKLRTKAERWFLGNSYHFAIGQGDLVATPIQINVASSAIASWGKYCKPQIVKTDKDGPCQDLKIKRENFELVREGMRQACSPGGTGYTFFDFAPGDLSAKELPNETRLTDTRAKIGRVACKTGTAETPEKDVTHAWFTVFGPIDSAEIVATILVEKGGEGSKAAGPVAREIFDYWFGARD